MISSANDGALMEEEKSATGSRVRRFDTKVYIFD